jgi:hypothetical protein
VARTADETFNKALALFGIVYGFDTDSISFSVSVFSS